MSAASGLPRAFGARNDEGRHAAFSLPLRGGWPCAAGSGGVEPQVRYWRRACSLLVWPFGPTPTLDPSPQGGGRREHAACSDARSDPERGVQFANYHMPPIALSPIVILGLDPSTHAIWLRFRWAWGGVVPPSAGVDGGSWALGSSPREKVGDGRCLARLSLVIASAKGARQSRAADTRTCSSGLPRRYAPRNDD